MKKMGRLILTISIFAAAFTLSQVSVPALADTDSDFVGVTATRLYAAYYGKDGFIEGPGREKIKNILARFQNDLDRATQSVKNQFPTQINLLDGKSVAAFATSTTKTITDAANILTQEPLGILPRATLLSRAAQLFYWNITFRFIMGLSAQSPSTQEKIAQIFSETKCTECAILDSLAQAERDYPVGAVQTDTSKSPTEYQSQISAVSNGLGFAFDFYRRTFLRQLAAHLSLSQLPKGYETVLTNTGRAYGWKGREKNGDYSPTYKNSFLQPDPSIPISDTPSTIVGRKEKDSGMRGGFHSHLSFMFSYGTASVPVPAYQIQNLILTYEHLISKQPKFRRSLIAVLADRGVFNVVSEFFALGGQLNSGPGGGGKYMPRPLYVYVAVDGDELETQKTIIHEVFHFVMDRMDSHLWEESGRTAGALDHIFFSRWEERWLILGYLREHRNPWSPRLSPLIQTNQDSKILLNDIQKAFTTDDRKFLETLATGTAFYDNYVRLGMIEMLSFNANAETKCAGATQPVGVSPSTSCFRYTDDEVQDLAYLHAFNAQLLQQSLRLALSIAEKNNISAESAYGTPQFLLDYQRFLAAFVESQETTYNGVRLSAQTVMDQIIGRSSSHQPRPLHQN